MKDLAIIPIVDNRVLVNIIGDKYEFYRILHDDDDVYLQICNFLELKNMYVEDIQMTPEFEFDGAVAIVKSELSSEITEDVRKNFILLTAFEVFNALADEKITGLVDYLLFEKLYTNYLK